MDTGMGAITGSAAFTAGLTSETSTGDIEALGTGFVVCFLGVWSSAWLRSFSIAEAISQSLLSGRVTVTCFAAGTGSTA